MKYLTRLWDILTVHINKSVGKIKIEGVVLIFFENGQQLRVHCKELSYGVFSIYRNVSQILRLRPPPLNIAPFKNQEITGYTWRETA